MGVIGMDNSASIGNVRAVYPLNRFNMCEVEWHEDHVEPNGRKHQCPKRRTSLHALCDGSKAKMTRDHCLRSRGDGQGSLASRAPITTTNKRTPRTNCITPPSKKIKAIPTAGRYDAMLRLMASQLVRSRSYRHAPLAST